MLHRNFIFYFWNYLMPLLFNERNYHFFRKQKVSKYGSAKLEVRVVSLAMRQWTCWHHATRGWLAPNLPAGHTRHVVVRATLGTTASQQQRQGFFRPFVTTKYIIYAVKWRNWRMISFQNTVSLLKKWQPSQQYVAWKLNSLKQYKILSLHTC